MTKEDDIQVLIIEDVAADAVLVESELRKGGLTTHFRQVGSKEAFLQELQHDPPDIILSDHGLPSFDGFTALAITRDRCPEVPFIFVTDHLGEEKTIEAFESGAADCVLKNRLAKLVPAVQRALSAAEARRSRKEAEGERERVILELREAVARTGDVSVLLPICANCKRIRDTHDRWQQLETYLREHYDVEFTHGLCPTCVPIFFPRQLAGE
jgi:CheY-like chemotaxis protein